MPLIEDLSLFVSDCDAKTAEIAGLQIQGYFDERFDAFGDIEGRQITFFCKTSDVQLAGAKQGTLITFALENKTYNIVGVHPEDDGQFTELLLEE